ncbi:uncharacterized protein LOC121873514 [Homarus americanus]|uniref:Uncharacterized protein n=1 Tax=Homarus americanus TaxID=6706 RepID=A0A8J5MTE2_HOMAM|nr:uncharacterized protein LOC121873514 [Homarus americanus]KAG7162741.1 hypothetical protein Hamer_G018265 [Homarus americanus]
MRAYSLPELAVLLCIRRRKSKRRTRIWMHELIPKRPNMDVKIEQDVGLDMEINETIYIKEEIETKEEPLLDGIPSDFEAKKTLSQQDTPADDTNVQSLLHYDGEDNNDTTQIIKSPPATQAKKEPKRKKAESEEDPRIEEALNILKGAAASASSQQDECGVYGQHVANKLRNYSKRTRAIVQHHMNNTLFNADMGQFDMETRPFSACPTTASNIPTLGSYHSIPTPESHSVHSSPAPTPPP